jgi:hypothetical protein
MLDRGKNARSLISSSMLASMQAVAMIPSIVLRTVITLRRSFLQFSAVFMALRSPSMGSGAKGRRISRVLTTCLSLRSPFITFTRIWSSVASGVISKLRIQQLNLRCAHPLSNPIQIE